MTFGSLFAGIGGMDLGLERAGMTCKWQVEIDDYATRVLEKHWPTVRRYRDVRTFPPEPATDWTVDCIAGGFPCQDISSGGQKAGIEGERSGLWSEFARIVRLLRPAIVVVENVGDLAVRGLSRVLGDLATCGFNAEWQVLPASAFGAPHRRERLFIVANAVGRGCDLSGEVFRRNSRQDAIGPSHDEKAWRGQIMRGSSGPFRRVPGFKLRRLADGVPGELDAIRCYGNAIVPQVAEWIGRRIMQHMSK